MRCHLALAAMPSPSRVFHRNLFWSANRLPPPSGDAESHYAAALGVGRICFPLQAARSAWRGNRLTKDFAKAFCKPPPTLACKNPPWNRLHDTATLQRVVEYLVGRSISTNAGDQTWVAESYCGCWVCLFQSFCSWQCVLTTRGMT